MNDDMSLLMTGSEWFSSRPGGLNRYFFELFRAMTLNERVAAHGVAFGDAPALAGARSWPGGGTVARVRASRRREVADRPQVVDRHFALYGPPRSAYPEALQVVHFQGPWADESRTAGGGSVSVRVKKLIERRRYADADHFIVLSQPFADILHTEYGVAGDRISIIPPGVDTARFGALREPTDGPPVVLCVRRLESRMGIDILIRSWAEVRRASPDAQLRIVGTGTQESDLRALAASSPHASSITFTGRLSDAQLDQEYRGATLTVVPTLSLEGFGLIALESLAAGVPTIVTNCGGLPDAVKDLDPSLIVPIGDEEALASRIAVALSGTVPSEEQCVSHAEGFGWERVADRHVDLYRKLMGS